MGNPQTLLLALDYPRAQTFNQSDEQAVRKLVVWLENVKVWCWCGWMPRWHPGGWVGVSKVSPPPHSRLLPLPQIRQYPVQERKALGDTQSASWHDSFSKVCLLCSWQMRGQPACNFTLLLPLHAVCGRVSKVTCSMRCLLSA